jgi:hypothetical protein
MTLGFLIAAGERRAGVQGIGRRPPGAAVKARGEALMDARLAEYAEMDKAGNVAK